jgi:hypothetical protein
LGVWELRSDWRVSGLCGVGVGAVGEFIVKYLSSITRIDGVCATRMNGAS